jgi:NADH-quinone oxidoreductase subunit L
MGLSFWTAVVPFIGFLVNGILGSALKVESVKKKADYIAIVCVGFSFLASFLMLYRTINLGAFKETWFSWFTSGGLNLSFGGYVDSLTAVMLIVVTTVSLLVHIYSIGYMHDDPGYARFFAYLNLFTFSMLTLVFSPNFLQLFFGWEAVGLSSYLLIGFWYKKESAANAAIKAFIMNRVGDFLFTLGIIMVFWTFKTLNFDAVFSSVNLIKPATLSIIGLLLLGGAVGKSAQFPLHTWLPDAMEGPTPVSALIHAATMVAAGVFMVARCAPIYDGGNILHVVGTLGVITAFGAATIGLTQFDFKRVLAYSTLSQLGYMFTALGVGAYTFAMFHLFTHAFFKALLFLGSGSVIHATGEYDIRRMGGLAKYMKTTAITFIIASLALAGIPPLAGFFSKDEIMGACFANGHTIFWLLLVAGAFLTALYMGRLVFLVFFGEERFSDDVRKHLHESPKVITVPLTILAVLSVVAGFLSRWFEEFLGKSIPNHVHEISHGTEIALISLSVIVALSGILISAVIYYWKRINPESITSKLGVIYRTVYRKYYFDEIYDFLFVNGIGFGGGNFTDATDRKVVDGAVNGAASISLSIGNVLRKVQTGKISHYVLGMSFGLIALIILIWAI